MALQTDRGGWVAIIGILICIIVPYILGSLNFAIIISRIFFRDDIRKYGSGNAGMTNMLRTYGKIPAAATLLLDMSKGLLAVIFGRFIFWEIGAAVASLFVVLGHMFPCFYKFKGGKGVATTAMVALATNWVVFLLLLAVFLIIVIGTKYVSLGSVIGVALYPVFLARFYNTGWNVLAALIIAAFVIFMHRSNIKRIWNGTESKISLKSKKK
ncbi:MAG: glycerol-3-phosphate 1-O-acyltransferase PlsY [Clostridia bacterium]|nr:glycerol-3-phosphate 1-O-acyltransferase PlsY [Clostridia bacterium]